MNERPEFQTDLFESGLKVRRKVLGDAQVDAFLAGVNDVTAPLQKLVTEWCWGEIWNRPGLSHKERSMLNLAMLTALNRPTQLKAHAQGALNNGVPEEKLIEIVLQSAIYCGAPAALDSMKVIAEAIEEARSAASSDSA